MYRIELSPGEETAFRTVEELAVAIKRGVVTPRARIYHNASGKWLPIQFHPHYKIAVSMQLTQAALVAGPPTKPPSSLTLQQPADADIMVTPPAAAPIPVKPAPLPASPVTAAAPTSTGATPEKTLRKKRSRAEKPSGEKRRRSGKSSRELRLALVGALLIGGAQWVLSAPLFSRSESHALVPTPRRLITISTEAMNRVGAANTAAMVSVGESSSTAGTVPLPVPLPQSEPIDSVGEDLSSVEEEIELEEVEPAPDSMEVRVAPVASSDSLPLAKGDSVHKKTLKSVLRAVSGQSAPDKKAAPRR